MTVHCLNNIKKHNSNSQQIFPMSEERKITNSTDNFSFLTLVYSFLCLFIFVRSVLSCSSFSLSHNIKLNFLLRHTMKKDIIKFFLSSKNFFFRFRIKLRSIGANESISFGKFKVTTAEAHFSFLSQ